MGATKIKMNGPIVACGHSGHDAGIEERKSQTSAWFRELRDLICTAFEEIEGELTQSPSPTGSFERKSWERPGGGGGEMSLMKGRVFEKVGVNISTVHGEFSEQFRKEIPGAEKNPNFWASGISLVAHMHSPLVPAVHMNMRFIVTEKHWFGGGSDLNPMFENTEDIAQFHQVFREACDKHNPDYYPAFKKHCDEYFFIKHRGVARGAGGIFYDYLNSGAWKDDFAFTQEVGKAFLDVYPKLIKKHMHESWTPEQREHQLKKRGYYTEFNLLYDRGTRFGLMTGGNIEAILMSLPPVAKWD